jgi:hypothetical protein
VPTNAPNGPTPPQVVVSGVPTLGHVTLSVAGPNVGGTRASLWCQTATAPYGYTQTIPLVNFYIPPGAPQTQTQDYPLGDLQYQQFLFGEVNQIDGSGLTSATMTMVV